MFSSVQFDSLIIEVSVFFCVCMFLSVPKFLPSLALPLNSGSGLSVCKGSLALSISISHVKVHGTLSGKRERGEGTEPQLCNLQLLSDHGWLPRSLPCPA